MNNVDDDPFGYSEADEIASRIPILAKMREDTWSRLNERVLDLMGDQGSQIIDKVTDALWIRMHPPSAPQIERVDDVYANNESFGSF